MIASAARRVALIGLALVLLPALAAAQSENVKTVEGARGEQTTLTAQPHGLAEGLSVRALAVSAPGGTRWALSLIGAAPDDSIALHYGDEALPIEDVQRPEDGIGPTRVYVSASAFRTMAETATVRLTVGGTTAALPAQLRREMTVILERAT
jgi:hypothetical protein